MRSSAQKSAIVFTVVGLLIIGVLNVFPYPGQASSPELVPEPSIQETHIYNETSHINGTYHTINEKWALKIVHGDVETNLMVWNVTQNDETSADLPYQNDIAYRIGNTSYCAQFLIRGFTFKIGGLQIWSPMVDGAEFELAYSPIKYDGTIPTFDCNITYERIRVYLNEHSGSTFDITFFHHFRLDWNQTDMKVEVLFNFNNTRFYQTNGTEFNAGEPFTAEIKYSMALGMNLDKEYGHTWLVPTSINGTTMNYNLTLDSGFPLTLSKLEMRDTFTIQNGTGVRTSVGYSSMEAIEGSSFAWVIHGFPNLTYKDTQTIRSDPEITIYHDRVFETSSQGPGIQWGMAVAVIAIIAVGAASAVFFIGKRKKKQGKGSETRKKH